MPQIPALFLPKKEVTSKVQNKKPVQQKEKKKPQNKAKVSALFKGRIDGYQENNKVRIGCA